MLRKTVRKRRHKDPSYVRAPSIGLIIVVPHSVILIVRSDAYRIDWNPVLMSSG